ncbi:dienelactone hydrolase family protein [Oecophyllibacter saccharovorans]|uniref:dienelactone hydrolase family protein n=1 Tax=Oecophyllibacter saccharovorans TaxID=2558360 RepID=UPI0011708930|nr:dienelactone hydrolase family protein [Oecophyllibacter saccharovorans]TPW36733.1 dienelactone hydrolase family protein [Oecophyllibacter saccharovorans]
MPAASTPSSAPPESPSVPGSVRGRLRDLTSADGQAFQAWEALPPEGVTPRAGLIVLQEIFGLTDYIREVCNSLAEQGYHVLAPALFDPVRPGTVLAYDQAGLTEGLALRDRLSPGMPQQLIAACLDTLRKEHAGHAKGGEKAFPVGVLGFCWGGLLAWEAAQILPVNAANCWYGGGIAQHCNPPPACPTELQFGAEDSYIPPADWETIHKACPEVKIFIYPGAGHGFGCTTRASYDPEAASLAWKRTLEFFKTYL